MDADPLDGIDGVAAGDVLYRRLYELPAGEEVAAVGIDIDFMGLCEVHGHPGFDVVFKALAKRLAAAAHTDDLLAMHGWNFVVVAERLADDADALTAYAGELEHAASAQPVEVNGENAAITLTVRSGMVGSTWDLRRIFLSPTEEKPRREERRRARLEADGPQTLDDMINITAGPIIQYSDEHPEGVGVDSIWPDASPILRIQLAVDIARNTELLDHAMVGEAGHEHTIKVVNPFALMELVKDYLLPLREAKLEEMHQEFLARCEHARRDDDGLCPECEEKWNWWEYDPRRLQLH
jgi:GGDEF domain-containing protein